MQRQYGWKSCFGRGAAKAQTNATRALEKGACDYGNTEGGYGSTLRKFPWPPRNLLLLRNPETHAASQFSHCARPASGARDGRPRRRVEGRRSSRDDATP